MKRITLLVIGLILLSVSFVSASNEEKANAKAAVMTTSIEGTVLDEITGESLAGVRVSIKGTSNSVYTDFEGKFKFNGVVPGNVKLETSYISYKNKVEEIDIDVTKDNNVDVKMESITE